MEPRLSLITLGVDDVARARAFYEALGFMAVRAQQRERRLLSRGRRRAGAVRPRVSPRMRAVDDSPPGFSGIALAHNVRSEAEVEQVLAEAVAAGGQLVKPRQERLLGRLLRLLRRSRRPPVGGGAQPLLPARRRRAGLQAAEVARHTAMNHDRYSDDYIAGILGDARVHRLGRRQRHHQPSELLRHEVSARQGLQRHPRQSGRSPARRSSASRSTPRSPTCRRRSTSSTSSATRRGAGGDARGDPR